MDLTKLYFSLHGRISRSTYWKMLVIPTVIVGFVGGLVDALAGLNGYLTIGVSILLLWPSICLSVKRWHDRNKSGWWVLISFIPVFGGLWNFVVCGFLPSITTSAVDQDDITFFECPKCGGKVAEKAIICRHCAYQLKLPDRPIGITGLAIYFIIISIVGLIFCFNRLPFPPY